ncbi:hypothetical protein GCM10022226_13400 [Sphaerisporangium flaviroseum]|uniref:Uncharacterized protein n=1 Tax=Sphaerisporangium flaviroseum TaxID=509199 RepID=A0ABP7HKB0_9ACTN
MEVFLGLFGIPKELGDQGLQWVRTIVSWLGSPMSEQFPGPGQQAFAELSAPGDWSNPGAGFYGTRARRSRRGPSQAGTSPTATGTPVWWRAVRATARWAVSRDG